MRSNAGPGNRPVTTDNPIRLGSILAADTAWNNHLARINRHEVPLSSKIYLSN